MPVLANAKHEMFARAIAEGKQPKEAYASVGYKPNQGNASSLAHKQHILNRVNEIKNFATQRTEIAVSVTLEGLIADATRLLSKAESEGQISAAVAALTAKAKLAGLWIERGDHVNTNVNYAVGEQPMTEEEWASERVTEH